MDVRERDVWVDVLFTQHYNFSADNIEKGVGASDPLPCSALASFNIDLDGRVPVSKR